jgi:ABC-2 type transport system ATP-binding protein
VGGFFFLRSESSSVSAAAISLESVSKRYGSKTIVHDLSFTVQPGEIVGFLGPNGAGKTTTMRMISGYTTPSSGRLRAAFSFSFTMSKPATRKLGYLPEQPPLYDALEVAQYLRFVAKVKSVPSGEIKSEIERVTTACRLADVQRKEIYKLSKGYRQRLGLAQALIGKPEVLLLDEPTAGLDPGQIQETREVIRSFGEKHAVLLSTHILPEVTMICARVAIINHGRLLAIDSPQALQRAAEQPNVSLVTDAPAEALRAELQAIDGVSEVVTRPAGKDTSLLAADCRVDARSGVEANIARAVTSRWNLYRLERQQPTLESIFLRYVQQPERAQ